MTQGGLVGWLAKADTYTMCIKTRIEKREKEKALHACVNLYLCVGSRQVTQFYYCVRLSGYVLTVTTILAQ